MNTRLTVDGYKEEFGAMVDKYVEEVARLRARENQAREDYEELGDTVTVPVLRLANARWTEQRHLLEAFEGMILDLDYLYSMVIELLEVAEA